MRRRTWTGVSWLHRALHGPPAPTREDVVRRVRSIRDRLAALEVQWLTLLADDTIPARKHRLDAVRAARRDLEVELDAIAGASAGASPGRG